MRRGRAWAASGLAFASVFTGAGLSFAPGCTTHECDTSSATYDGGEMVGPDMYVTNDLPDDWIMYSGNETLHVLFPPGVGRVPLSVSGQVGTSKTPNGGAFFMGGDNNAAAAGQLSETFFIDQTGFFSTNASCTLYYARFTVTFPPIVFAMFGGYGHPGTSADYATAGDGDAGSATPGQPLREAWTWNGTRWSDVYHGTPPSTVPPAVSGTSVAVASGTPYFFGGDLGTPGDISLNFGLVQWDGVSWSPRYFGCPGAALNTCPCCPQSRADQAFVTLRGQREDGGVLDKIVMFGGRAALPSAAGNVATALNETDIWDGTTWTQPKGYQDKAVDSPPGRWRTAAAAIGGKVYIFGGTADGKTPLDDTWVWDNTTKRWGPVVIFGQRPAPRFGAAAASFGTTMVLFGGNDGTKDLDDTWLFDGFTWTVVPGPGPSARSNVAIGAFADPPELLLFGGDTAGTPLGDFWSWDGSAWHSIPDLDGTFPAPRTGAAAGGI
jgi:hypothetical protein